MQPLNFIHCGDLHLDMPFSTLGERSGVVRERRQDLRNVLKKIVDITLQKKAQLLIISGDLYEHEWVGRNTINYINDIFSRIPGTHIVIVPGNHDPQLKNSYYNTFKWQDNVHLINSGNYLELKDINARIYGFGFTDFSQNYENIDSLKPADEDMYNIMVFHGSVDMPLQNGRSVYNPVKSSSLANAGMDYIALGHYHNYKSCIGGYDNIYNPGSPEPLGFDEQGIHGILDGRLFVNDIGKKQLQVDFIPTSARRYWVLEANIEQCSSDREVTEIIRNALPGTSQDLYEIRLTGYRNKDYIPATDIISENLLECTFYAKIKDNSIMSLDLESLRKDTGLKGLFINKMFQLIDNETDSEKTEVLRNALYLGLEALDEGKLYTLDGLLEGLE